MQSQRNWWEIIGKTFVFGLAIVGLLTCGLGSCLLFDSVASAEELPANGQTTITATVGAQAPDQPTPVTRSKVTLNVVAYPDVFGGTELNCPGCDGQYTTEDRDFVANNPLPDFDFIVKDTSGAKVATVVTEERDGIQMVEIKLDELLGDETYTLEHTTPPDGWVLCATNAHSRTLGADDFSQINGDAVELFYFIPVERGMCFLSPTVAPAVPTSPTDPVSTAAPVGPTASTPDAGGNTLAPDRTEGDERHDEQATAEQVVVMVDSPPAPAATKSAAGKVATGSRGGPARTLPAPVNQTGGKFGTGAVILFIMFMLVLVCIWNIGNRTSSR